MIIDLQYDKNTKETTVTNDLFPSLSGFLELTQEEDENYLKFKINVEEQPIVLEGYESVVLDASMGALPPEPPSPTEAE